MGKLFQLALEEAVETQPEVVEEIPVEELVNNAEELAKTDGEITQDVQAVEDLMEEKAKLEDQVATNDELLSNPDAVVTAADVEVSEECRSEVHYHLGYTSGVSKIRLSTESVYQDVKSHPRKYLAISNEDIKETIKKIWEKIKAFFKRIWDKIKMVLNKLGIYKKYEDSKLNNVNDKINNLDNSKEVKLEDVPAGKISTESYRVSIEASDGNISDSILYAAYNTCPILAVYLRDEKLVDRITDPARYTATLKMWDEVAERVLNELGKAVTLEKEVDDLSDLMISLGGTTNILGASVYPTVNDGKLFDLFTNQIAVPKNKNPRAIFSVGSNAVTYLVDSDKNGLYGFETVSIELNRNVHDILRESGNVKYNKNKLLQRKNYLSKTGKFLNNTLADSVVKKHKEVEKLIDDTVAKIDREGFNGNWVTVFNRGLYSLRNLINPGILATYIEDCRKNRLEMIKILDACCGYINSL